MKRIKFLLRITIPIVCFVYLGAEIVKLSGNTRVNYHVFDIGTLLISLVLLLVIFLADAIGWQLILRSLKQELDVSKGIFIWFYSSFCRYIPGIIWPYLTRIDLCNSEGLDKNTVGTSMILENILLASTSVILSIPIIIQFYPLNFIFVFQTAMLFFLVVTIALLISKKEFFRVFIDKYMLSIRTLTKKNILLLATYYIVFWLIFGISFLVFCSSIINVEKGQYLLLVLAFPVSFAIGFIASISPGGLGIREGVLYTLLSLQLSNEDAALIALTSRLWLFSTEVFIAIAIVCIYLIGRFLRQ